MAEQGTQAAVLFADVSGSTKLYETAGDQVMSTFASADDSPVVA